MKYILAIALVFSFVASAGAVSGCDTKSAKKAAVKTKTVVKATAAYAAPSGEWTIPAYIGGNMSYFFKADGTVRIFCEEGGIDWPGTWKVSGNKLIIKGEGASVWTFKDANTLQCDKEILKKK